MSVVATDALPRGIVAAAGEYAQYRAPQRSGRAVVLPSVDELLRGMRSSHAGFDQAGLEFCGKSLDEVRRQARAELVRLALAHTLAYASEAELPVNGGVESAEIETRPLILSGHQPELFHAGVWFKNFLLSELGESSDGIAINFLVDNDLCRSTSIRVPTMVDGRAVVASVPFDAPRGSVPWELRRLQSQDVWNAFPQAVETVLKISPVQPLVHQLWPLATEALQRSGRIGQALAEARHLLELRAGLRTLEVPLSELVSTRAFARFSIGLLSELPRFQDVYNDQRDRYRAAHKIRNNAHPVPPLHQDNGWIEAPWWVYSDAAPTRQPLWVKLLDEQLLLSDRAGWQHSIEGRLKCDSASSQWLELLADGIRLRPRALLTTMYLRLIVGDLFLHGIGGGKYDQLTNAIMREFFKVEPPPMAVATATLHLPLADAVGAERAVGNGGRPSQGESAVADDSADDLNSIEGLEAAIRGQHERLWQLKYHAEDAPANQPNGSHLDSPARVAGQAIEHDIEESAEALAMRKRELLANIPPRGEKWQWHQEMTAINRQLNLLSSVEVNEAKQRLAELNQRLKEVRVLKSREYSFCLYPAEMIIPQLQRLAGGVAE